MVTGVGENFILPLESDRGREEIREMENSLVVARGEGGGLGQKVGVTIKGQHDGFLR